MGKSSSHKKKRSRKISSQGRTKKKTKSRSRRYNKSKKIRYHDDSLSHSSDDDSRSFMSVSCSGSEDDYRSRRARSHTRKDLKGSKKKDRRRSFSRERSEESRRVRKKIGSKRKGGSDLGTKTHKKKRKPSREVSVSSIGSDSCSCDARQVGSTSSHEREFERPSHKGRYDGKERRKGKSEKVRSGSKRSRYRSRSCSSCTRSSEGDEYWSEVKKAGENNVKRLRSVITVIEEEGRFSDNDEHKEEIVYDNDDYPSCRSNDSNDGGHKRELDHRSNVASDNNMMAVNEKKGEEPVVSNIRTTDLTESFKDVEGQRSGTNPSSCMVGTNDFVKGKVTEGSGSLNGEDLESTLRQRALENLKRFRGGFQPNANIRTGKKDDSCGDMKQSSTVKSEIVQIKLPKEDGVKTVGGAKSWKGDGSKSVGATQELKEISVPVLRSNSNSYSQKNENTSSGTEGDHQSVTAKQEIACVPDPMAVAGQPSEKLNSAVVSEINIPKLATPALRHNSFKNHNTLKERSALDEPRQTNLLVTKSASVECAPETAQSMTPTSNNNNNEDVKNACGPAAPECSSCIKSTLAVDGSNKSQDETTDGSQFEQKTMTVMRGGEMVQVSYKVYIPKKAPAFTRRQLKR
ncbi:hypothetical protein F2P56_005228 [Juglans regia]|uniref:NK-tumor recognition protein n=2 Tax=Juglans regia TaxID=51240 RepID=A0A2I4H3X7_JUGRE|nr:NK-tumor recognition protein [Juglans regia]KAF5478688.1 hypothetical protein F2P56_005228 [Juglans regia]